MTNGVKEWFFRVLEQERGLVVLLFCLPASFIFDLTLKICNKFYKLFKSAPELHDERVKKIQHGIATWNKENQTTRKRLVTARPNWLSISPKFFRKDLCQKIPVDLYDILSLDEINLKVRVEPMVTVGDILKYLIPKGYALAATVELNDATLGGLALSTGMTTHSHHVGLYQECVLSYEVILGDGSLVRATKDNEYSDLFKALPCSHGSLGFLVALEVQIIRVKPFVHMTYLPVIGMKNYCKMLTDLCGPNDKSEKSATYLEATIYSKEKAILMIGEAADIEEYPHLDTNYLGANYKPWFYKYAETFFKIGKHEELIPLRDYLLRHNRSIYWVLEHMIPFGNNAIFRFCFGWLLPPKPAFLKYSTTPGVRELTFTKQVFQDFVTPISYLENQIEKCEEIFDIYPLLVYPCRIYDHGPDSGQLPRPKPEYLCPGTNYAMYTDVGVYGVPGFVRNKKPYDPVNAMRSVEKFTRSVGGFSFLYADIFMDEEEFGEMFDLSLYRRMRVKYGAECVFPTLYEKVKPEIDVLKHGVSN